MKKLGIVLILFTLALALTMTLAGCGSKGSTTSQSSTTPASTAAKTSTTTSSNTPATHPAQEPVVAEAPTQQPETTPTETATTPPQNPATPEASTPSAADADTDPNVTFSKSIQALQSLASYRYTTTMKYEGTGDAAADSGTTEVRGEYSAPDRYHLTIIESSENKRSEFVKIGDSLWISDAGKWTKVPDMAVPAMSQSIFNFGLAFVWGNLAEGLDTGANYIGRETVNGTKSRHYSSTNSSWEKGIKEEFQNAHGDVWIAEAGYPVKFVFTTSGTDEDGNYGSMEWRSDVTDVNSKVMISAPTLE